MTRLNWRDGNVGKKNTIRATSKIKGIEISVAPLVIHHSTMACNCSFELNPLIISIPTKSTFKQTNFVTEGREYRCNLRREIEFFANLHIFKGGYMSDPSDLPFIELSLHTHAPIITGNVKHFPSELTVLTPADFLNEFKKKL